MVGGKWNEEKRGTINEDELSPAQTILWASYPEMAADTVTLKLLFN
jgi:hypothetical protein